MANILRDTSLNAMLDALAAELDQVSLHTAWSTTGANEVTGGSYARQSITWNAAASGALNSSNAPSFSVPGTPTTVRFIGFWETAASPDTFEGMVPNQQAGDVTAMRFIVNTAADTIEAPAHGLVHDDAVVFLGGTAPGGLTEGTVYYVGNVTTDDFDVQTTQASPISPVTLTTQGDQDVRFYQIREETFSADGTFNLNDMDFDFLT